MTLLELLVVIAILGIVAAALPALMSGGPPSREAALREVRAALAATRAEAIRSGAPASLVLDPEAGRLSGPGGTVVLADGLALGAMRGAAPVAEIRFHPDGSSDGGRIALSDARGTSRLSVHWLTGAIRREAAQ